MKIRETCTALSTFLADPARYLELNLCNPNMAAKMQVESLRQLADALQSNEILTSLNLASNRIGPNGIQTILDVLKHNKTLQHLYLQANEIGPEIMQSLAQLFPCTLISLNLSNNFIGLKGMQSLARFLQDNAILTELNISGNNIGHDGVQILGGVLQNNETLAALDLSFNNIWHTGAQYLAETLMNNKSLTYLAISHNSMGTMGIESLAQALPCSLTSLNLNNNDIGTRGMLYLVQFLQNNGNLTNLYLENNYLGPDGVRILVDGLRSNSILSELYLGYNSIRSEGVQELGKLLQENTSLTIINLNGGNHIEYDGVRVLADALHNNVTLSELCLKYSSIGTEGAQELVRMLERNTSLIRCDISDSSIAKETLGYIAELVNINYNIFFTPVPIKYTLESISSERPTLDTDFLLVHLKCYQNNRATFNPEFNYDIFKLEFIRELNFNKIDNFINGNFFYLTAVCKSLGNSPFSKLTLDVIKLIVGRHLKLSDIDLVTIDGLPNTNTSPVNDTLSVIELVDDVLCNAMIEQNTDDQVINLSDVSE